MKIVLLSVYAVLLCAGTAAAKKESVQQDQVPSKRSGNGSLYVIDMLITDKRTTSS